MDLLIDPTVLLEALVVAIIIIYSSCYLYALLVKNVCFPNLSSKYNRMKEGAGGGWGQTEIDRQTRDTDNQREGERERQTDRQTETKTERERERGWG